MQLTRRAPAQGQESPACRRRLRPFVAAAAPLALLLLVYLELGLGRHQVVNRTRVVTVHAWVFDAPAAAASGASRTHAAADSMSRSGDGNQASSHQQAPSKGVLCTGPCGGLEALPQPEEPLRSVSGKGGSSSSSSSSSGGAGSRVGLTPPSMRRSRSGSSSGGAEQGRARRWAKGKRRGLHSSLPPEVSRHFVAATATATHRHVLAKAMRAWRRGIRTLVLTNATGEALAQEQAEGRKYNETWAHYPDLPGFAVTGKPGDPRAAVAPALARAQLGEFKWLIYGDDDVAWFWPGLLRMLQGLNPEDPYFLTDNYYSRWPTEDKGQGRRDQPRCVPCTLDDTGLDLRASHALKTCNCSTAAMAAEFKGLLHKFKSFPHRQPISTVAGAGGAVLSIGLLRRLNASLFESCMQGNEGDTWGPEQCGGSDCLLTSCLWHQGYGYTDPGFSLRHKGVLLFNTYGNHWKPGYMKPGGHPLPNMREDLKATLAGQCSADCRLRLDHTVSVHTHGAKMAGSYALSAAGVQRFLEKAAVYAEAAAPLEALAGQLVL